MNDMSGQACGFELRHEPVLPFKSLALTGFPPDSPLALGLKRQIKRTPVQLLDDPARAEVVLEALRICGMAGYRNGTEFSIGRHLRDILSAQLMINNDRIASGTGAMLFAQRAELGTL